MSINNYLKEILNGDLDKVKSYDTNLINEIGKVNPKGYDLIPLFAAIALYSENNEKGRKMIEYLLSIPNVNVSKKVVSGGQWTNEITTLYHLISSVSIDEETCGMILNHPSFNIDIINTIDHDDYRPLDLADKYNPKIVNLLESKGAKRHWRVGPGFKNGTCSQSSQSQIEVPN